MEPQELNVILQKISNDMSVIDNQLAEYKALNQRYEEFRDNLFDVMAKHDVKKFISLNGTQYTVVDETPDRKEIVIGLNEKKLKDEKPKIYKQYLEEKEIIKKGKTSYLRITLPKDEKEEER